MSQSEERPKVALITGITGQDGSYLAEFLIERGYTVHGIMRRSSSFNTGRIEHLYEDPHVSSKHMILHYGDMTDLSNLNAIIREVQPTEVYNLAAQSHVRVSFDMPTYTADVDALGVLRLLEAIRANGLTETCRFYQASTSELYGGIYEEAQTEKTPFYPRSPYAVAKQFAYWIVVNYRQAYGMHASNGILFNHESPRRGPTFVTRKITRAVARIYNQTQRCLYLGNLDATRDWGHAKDYVRMMHMMLQQDEPDDYVVATNEGHSVREFVEKSFGVVGVTIGWEGEGTDEVGKVTGVSDDDQDRLGDLVGQVVVRIDEQYFRPTEVNNLLGDASYAEEKLGWKPQISFQELVEDMVNADIELLNTSVVEGAYGNLKVTHK